MRYFVISILPLSVCLLWAGHAYAAGCREVFEAAELSQEWHEAVRICGAEAAAGNAEAQFYFGEMYYRGNGVEIDLDEAMRWYRVSAEQGEAKAQNDLGLIYFEGNGVPQDYAEAARWFRRAAEQDNAISQFGLDPTGPNGPLRMGPGDAG